MLLAFLACSETEVDPGSAKSDDYCAWAPLAWRDTFANSCDAGTPRTGIEACYDPLVITVEPIAIDDEAGTMDLAACLNAKDVHVYEGSVELASGSLNDAESALPGFLSADDGLDPCLGMTAGLDGDFTLGAVFTDGSYWWADGDDPTAAEDVLIGVIDAEGELVSLSPPTITYATLPVELGLGSTLDLPLGEKDHWDTPEASCGTGGGA